MKSVFSAMLLSLMVFSLPTGAQEHRKRLQRLKITVYYYKATTHNWLPISN